MFKRTEYILRNLSKISHKQYELYVISRIVHLLDDPEIEFVCQQLIRVNSVIGIPTYVFHNLNCT